MKKNTFSILVIVFAVLNFLACSGNSSQTETKSTDSREDAKTENVAKDEKTEVSNNSNFDKSVFVGNWTNGVAKSRESLELKSNGDAIITDAQSEEIKGKWSNQNEQITLEFSGSKMTFKFGKHETKDALLPITEDKSMYPNGFAYIKK